MRGLSLVVEEGAALRCGVLASVAVASLVQSTVPRLRA